jgi:hypothetical protein
VTAAASTLSLFDMDFCCDQVGDLVPKLVDDGLAGLRTNERRLQHPWRIIH